MSPIFKPNYVRLFDSPRHFAYELHLCMEQHDGHHWLDIRDGSVVFIPRNALEGDVPEPVHMDYAAGQQLMDDLWRAGVRPTDARTGNELVEALTDARDDARKVRDLLLDFWTDTE